MPKIEYKSRDFPEWSDVKNYAIISLNPGEKRTFAAASPKQIIFLCEGECSLEIRENRINISGGSFRNIKTGSAISIIGGDKKSTAILLEGNWSDETGGCGIFSLGNTNYPKNTGDPSFYWRNTDFDKHYHDCDEYWIFYAGKGIAVSEEIFFNIEAGDCIATKMGDHHDIPVVYETLRGIYFETSLKGEKRAGHLWNHAHAPKEEQNEL